MLWEQGSEPEDDEYAAGFVLAGGKSSRMGQDKSLLRLDGQTLIERAVGRLREVCPEVSIAGGSPELTRYARVILDSHPGNGPLGGIVAALETSHFEWNLFLAVDMPHVPVTALRRLLAGTGGGSLVMLAQSNGQVQPLCGVYSRRVLPVLREHLLAGQLRVRAAVEATGAFRYVPFDRPDWFANLNTPADFAQAEKHIDALDA